MKKYNRTRQLELAAHEKGAIGVTLLKESLRRYSSRNLVEEFILEDLKLDSDTHLDLQLSFQPNLQVIERDDEKLQWRPDTKLIVRRMPSDGGEYLAEYLIEVKTGRSADFRKDQREVMQALAQRGIPTLTVWIILDQMPDSYGMRIRKMGEYVE